MPRVLSIAPPSTPGPSTYVVVQPTEAAIRQQVDLAIAAGGGRILLPDATIPLVASLPMISGISYIGVNPRVDEVGMIPDDTFTLRGGTILVGNSTFPCFRPGLNDSLTYFDDSPVTVATLTASSDRASFTYNPNWQTGVPVTFQNTANGLTAATSYYLRRVTANLYEFYDTKAHAIALGSTTGIIDITTAVVTGNGNCTPNQVLSCNADPTKAIAYTTSTNNTSAIVVTNGASGGAFVVGQGIVFTASANSTVTIGRTYYITSISTDTLTVATSPTSTALIIGTGNPGITPWLANKVVDCEISNIGFGSAAGSGFTRAISCGAKNQFGAAFCTFDNLWIRDCVTSTNVYDPDMWAIYLANFHHTRVKNIRTYNVSNNVWFSASVNAGTLQTGNSMHENIVLMNNLMSAGDRRKQRGFCYIGEYDGFLNEMKADRLQFTRFNNTQLSEVVSVSAGSSVIVADATLYTVGMPVVFGTTFGNITANQVLFVVSTPTATSIAVSDTRNGTPVTAAAGAPTLKTWGQPVMECYGDRVKAGATLSKVTNFYFINLDLEGDSSAALFLERCLSGQFHISQFGNGNATVHPMIVLRNSSTNLFTCVTTSATTDMDGGSVQNQYIGARDTSLSYQNIVPWWGLNAATGAFELGIGNAAVSVRPANIQHRTPAGAQMTKFLTSEGSLCLGDYGATGAANMGHFATRRYIGTGNGTLTLPTITREDTTNAAGSIVGARFLWINGRSGILTVNTDGTQLVNGLTGVTSFQFSAPSSGVQAMCEVEAYGDGTGTAQANFFWLVKPFQGCRIGTGSWPSEQIGGTVFAAAASSNTIVTVPAGHLLCGMTWNSNLNPITGGLRIGTTANGTDVVTAQTIPATSVGALADAAMLKKYFSATTGTQLFISAVTNWASAVIDLSFIMEKVTLV